MGVKGSQNSHLQCLNTTEGVHGASESLDTLGFLPCAGFPRPWRRRNPAKFKRAAKFFLPGKWTPKNAPFLYIQRFVPGIAKFD